MRTPRPGTVHPGARGPADPRAWPARPRLRSPTGSGSPPPRSAATWTRWSPTGVVEAREQRVRGPRGPRPPGQGLRAHRRRAAARSDQAYDDLAVERPALPRARPAAEDASQAFARRRSAGSRSAIARSPRRARPTSRNAPGARRGADRGRLRRLGPSRAGCGRRSSASTTARWRTSPTSSRSCARPRPRCSPGCSAPTSSAWPPSPTATASAPRIIPAGRPASAALRAHHDPAQPHAMTPDDA